MRWHRFAPLILIAATSCQGTTTSGVDPESVSQPQSARFRCSGGKVIGVENLGASVSLTKPDGSVVALPALPAGSRSRFSEGQIALVFDGRNALLMETGKSPLECRR